MHLSVSRLSHHLCLPSVRCVASDADRTPPRLHAIEAAQKAVEARLREDSSSAFIVVSLKRLYKHKMARRPIDLLAFVLYGGSLLLLLNLI